MPRWCAGRWSAQQMLVLAKPGRPAECFTGEDGGAPSGGRVRQLDAHNTTRQSPEQAGGLRTVATPSLPSYASSAKAVLTPPPLAVAAKLERGCHAGAQAVGLHSKWSSWRSQDDQRSASRAKMAVHRQAVEPGSSTPTTQPGNLRSRPGACAPSRHQVSQVTPVARRPCGPCRLLRWPPSWSVGATLVRRPLACTANARPGEARTTGGVLRGRRWRCTVRRSSPAARRPQHNPAISGAGRGPAHRRDTKSPELRQ